MDELKDAALSMAVALCLISEKVHFWSDDQVGLDGSPQPPRCLDPRRANELRQSLREIGDHCRTAQRIYQEAKDKG